MKTTVINIFSVLALGSVIALAGACKKTEEPEAKAAVKVQGCSDKDSPLYNEDAVEDDNSCKYAVVSKYEITYHPEKDGNNENWDPFTSTDADLILKIKEQGASSWAFTSAAIQDQEHNVPAQWNATSPLKLLNKTYEWELTDEDTGTADDFVSSGTFNPISLATEGTVTTVSGGSKLKIYYNLQ